MVPIPQGSHSYGRCECVCGCDSRSPWDSVTWMCTSHCGSPVCGACVATTNPLICHWCLNPLYYNPTNPQGCIPRRAYTDHGFVGRHYPPLSLMQESGWVVPLAWGRQANPMYNESGIIIDNFKQAFYAPSIVKIPIENTNKFFLRACYLGQPGGPSVCGTVNIFKGNEYYGVYYCDLLTQQPCCKCGKCHIRWLHSGWRCTLT